MSLRSRISVWFRNHHFDRLVVERLRGKDLRDDFIERVIRSMKERPDEWEVFDWKAKHKSGVVIDCKDSSRIYNGEGSFIEEFYGYIVGPTYLLIEKVEAKSLGDAFDYLAKLKVLEALRMDRK